MPKTLNCMHREDWMCPLCCKCGVCCRCEEHRPLVHINSIEAHEAWRSTMKDEARKSLA